MRRTVAINNAIKYLDNAELTSASNSHKENLSKELSGFAYHQMLSNVNATRYGQILSTPNAK